MKVFEPMALKLNSMLGSSVEEQQMQAAVFFVGLSRVIRDTQKPEDVIIDQVFFAAGLLHRMSGWTGAADIVMQLKESFDGTGAPFGLKGDEIQPASQVLGLSSEFASIVALYADAGYKQSLFAAVKVINSKKGTRYKDKLIERFNNLIKSEYLNHHQW